MKPRKQARSWNLSPQDLPSETALARADYLIGLENNAVFRLLTYRATPFWRRTRSIVGLMIALFAIAATAAYNELMGLIIFSASGLIFYLSRLFYPDDFALDELTAADLEDVYATRVGVRDIALAIWGVRTSQRWIAARMKAARIALWTGWVIVLSPIMKETLLGVLAGWLPLSYGVSTRIIGMLLIASGASIRQRMLAAPAHALPQCLRILDEQIRRLETRKHSLIEHAVEVFNLLLAAFAKTFVLLFWFILLIVLAYAGSVWTQLAASRGVNVYFPPDLQGLFLGALAWGIGRTDGYWWRGYVEPDLRRNYMELMEKVQIILRREQRVIVHGELEQRFPRPEWMR